MQDLSKKIKYLKIRKKIWRSWPYRFYLRLYHNCLQLLLRLNKKNVRIVFINGMRRSGNHYLMKTIMDSSSSTIIFYNNQKKNSWLDIKNGLQTKYRISKSILLIVGYEDLLIEEYIKSCNYILTQDFKTIKNLKLLITRDVRNIMASRLNHAHMAKELREKPDILIETRDLWINHHCLPNDNDFISIRYNNLINDLTQINLKPYSILNLIESKKILNRYGGGSSFESNDFNSRFKNFNGDNVYQSLIKELQSIDEQIYEAW